MDKRSIKFVLLFGVISIVVLMAVTQYADGPWLYSPRGHDQAPGTYRQNATHDVRNDREHSAYQSLLLGKDVLPDTDKRLDRSNDTEREGRSGSDSGTRVIPEIEQGSGVRPQLEETVGETSSVATSHWETRLTPTVDIWKVPTSQASIRRQKLIILTYMRSGSSFTGDLFHQHPQTFYVYEPLHLLHSSYKDNMYIRYFQGHIKIPKGSLLDADSEAVNTLENYLSCRFQDVDVDSLMQYHMGTSNDTIPFMNCFLRQKGLPVLRSCLHHIRNPCQNRKVTVLKVIRMSMVHARKLLTSDPDLKVLHLIRDPRGMFLSQYFVGDLKWKKLDSEASQRCARILSDVEESARLNKDFPGRILTARYEDIAELPIQSAEWLYNWLGLHMTDNEKNYIGNITHGHNDTCAICTTRKDAVKTAYNWMKYLYWEEADIIQKKCSKLLHVMGFRRYRNVQELNAFLPAKFDDFSNALAKIKYKRSSKG